jgi:DNA polymerase-3 subunit epsilon
MTSTNIENIIKTLEETEDYKILKRFKRVEYYNPPTSEKKSIGIFVDVETTGSYAAKDQIIELALVPFEYSDDGRIFRVLESYVEFQDPGIPIPNLITELTGITDEMVAGKFFDDKKVNELVESASIIIAHHAAFDKKFVERIFPIFKEKLWGCTVAHIKWRKEKISSAKLEFLAYSFGIFYKAHRAEIDSLIGVHILAQNLPVTGELALKILLENSGSKHFRIWAENSPFDMKNILKARGYRWNDGSNNKPKSWYKIIREQLKQAELEFLYNEIYDGEVSLRIEAIKLFEDI